jgi:hypothetical protein
VTPRRPGLIPRPEAALALGVSERTLRRHAGEWGIETRPGRGRHALVTRQSVNARLRVLHDGTASG